jgi:hypothetical protein
MSATDAPGLSGTGFSLWVLVFARINPHRLKPVPLFPQMKDFRCNFLQKIRLATLVAMSFAALPVASQQPATPKVTPAPKRDLSGLWHYESTGASEPIAPDDLIPPMTPWAKAKFETERPGFGPRRTPNGNDPILQCDPTGFPRVMFLNTPFEFVQIPGRVFQFFEHEHEYRTIWTDGRPLPKDADPTWYGYATGRWEGDDTFVVESAGFNEKTWLGSTGYPHSEDMRITERYRRVDHDTILYEIAVTDPKAYTRPIVGPRRTMKLRPHDELVEEICVPSEEKSFAERVGTPASSKPVK